MSLRQRNAQSSDRTSTQESLTFTTKNFHGSKWITTDGATEILICRNNPFTGIMVLEYENRLVAECIVNSCKTYFTNHGAFKIQSDMRSGVLKWKISPITMKNNGKVFKCSDGLETLRLSPIVEQYEESLTFTTENVHDGKWITRDRATEILICRSNAYTGKMALIYENQGVAKCTLNSCKTYFTDYDHFNIQFDIKNGVIKWKINPVTMKYNGKLFKCSDGIETLRLSPIVEDNFLSGIPLLFYAFSLVLAIVVYVILLIRSADPAGIHEDLNIGWSTKDLSIKTVAEGKLSVKPAIPRPTRRKNIIINDLTFVKFIGKGSFGEVWKGVWRNSRKDKVVALKKFTTGGKDQTVSNVEVELMQRMDHENIIQFYGTCSSDDDIIIVVMELIENGNLLQYLLDKRRSYETRALVDIGSQIVNGLIYLESHLIIHRDLAARNILVNSLSNRKTVRTVKIADFGLARKLENENSEYIPERQEPFPLRWTAPEAIEYKIFTFKSDVWSFGILLMEIAMFGLLPYAEMADEEILPYLKQSPENRMECPKHCHPELYQIMQMCWKLNRAKRPTFKELKKNLIRFDNLKQ